MQLQTTENPFDLTQIDPSLSYLYTKISVSPKDLQRIQDMKDKNCRVEGVAKIYQKTLSEVRKEHGFSSSIK